LFDDGGLAIGEAGGEAIAAGARLGEVDWSVSWQGALKGGD